ncbi:MAG: stage II sporulation protein M [Anaerolineales bacterium]|nr:stage II sporulation protein M [Anaerolineales bacterium]
MSSFTHRFGPAWIITRREVRDQFRDWRIIIPIFVLTLIFPSIMNFTAERAVTFVERYGANIVGDRLIPFLLMVVGFFPISVSLVIALESFVGEKERKSIEPLLSSPLEDWHMYLGKLIAVMVPPLIASYLGIAVYLWGVYQKLGWTPEPILLIQILLLTFVQAIVMVSGAVVISTQATSVRAANLLASFVIIPMSFVIQGESMVMFWAAYKALWWVILAMVVLAVLLVRMGLAHFNREALLGRELDTLDVKAGLKFFRKRFVGEARSLGEWFRHEIPVALRRMRLPIMMATLILIGAIAVGLQESRQFALPKDAFDLNNFQLDAFSQVGTISLLETQGVGIIWFHNLRAAALAFLLGIISFGVFGVLILMLPFVLIGYFMGTLTGAGIPPLTFLAGFILPHGIFEIPAIILVGAGIVYMGGMMLTPTPDKTIGDAWMEAMADWAKVMVGLGIPLFFFAAILEVFLTPRVVVWLLG